MSRLPTLHCHNWLSPRMITSDGVKTACNLRRPIAAFAPTPQVITCDNCSLKVLRTGQERGLSTDDIRKWTWEDLGASPPPKETA